VHAEHFAAPNQHTVCLASLSDPHDSPESTCERRTWIEYGRLYRASRLIHAESRSLFEARYVPRHRFFFDDVALLAALYRRTRWRLLRATLDHDARMAITGGRAAAADHWRTRGRDALVRVLAMVADAAGYGAHREGMQRFLDHIDYDLGQSPGRVTRSVGWPVRITGAGGLLTKFWYAEVSNNDKCWTVDRATYLPSIFMEGDLGSLPFIEQLVEMISERMSLGEDSKSLGT